MKRYALITLLFAALSLYSSRAEEPLSADDFTPVISFEKNITDLGDIDSAGGDREFEFRFVNSGNAPLVLTYVHASCGCVRLKYPRQPIAPGDSSSISGLLSPATIHEPVFKRNILVRSNAKTPQTRLFITGKIKKSAED